MPVDGDVNPGKEGQKWKHPQGERVGAGRVPPKPLGEGAPQGQEESGQGHEGQEAGSPRQGRLRGRGQSGRQDSGAPK